MILCNVISDQQSHIGSNSQSLPPTPHHPLTPSSDTPTMGGNGLGSSGGTEGLAIVGGGGISMTPTIVSTPHLQQQHTTPCENYRFPIVLLLLNNCTVNAMHSI